MSVHQEIRFAVVLNGGVSLAVWMGGATHELNELTWKRDVPTPYNHVLDLLDASARVDVIAGTSAGGINGAALALGQVNKEADLARLRELWSEQGRLDTLMRPPFQGQPASLLRGEFFHEQLLGAMEQLTDNFVAASGRPVHLTLTTTLLTGAQDITLDSLGNVLSDVRHDGRFRFEPEHFAVDQRDATVPALALAARSSAGFPVAFEPAFVPVLTGEPDPLLSPAKKPKDPLHPDMSAYAQWSIDPQAEGTDRSRFVVDGGVLNNTPTEPALDAIAAMETGSSTRRVMLLIYPHAPAASTEVASVLDTPPSVLATLAGVAEAAASVGSRTFVAEIDEHNRTAEGWRDGRSAALRLLADHGVAPRSLVTTLWPLFQSQRKRRAASRWALAVPPPQPWPIERTRRAVEEAQETRVPDSALNYFPAEFDDNAPGWPWEPEMALAVTDAAADALRRALTVATQSEAVDLADAGKKVSAARTELRALARAVAKAVVPPPLGDDQLPDAGYWDARLTCFNQTMTAKGAAIRAQVDLVVAALEGVARTFGRICAQEERWKAAGLVGWERLTGPTGKCGAWPTLHWLLALEIVTSAASDGTRPSSTVPIDLVQLSLAARGPLLGESRSGDDKLAGLALGHFAGFLKRSWRVNDWIWGRLDAVEVLMQALLTEDAVRGLGPPFERVVPQLVGAFFGGDELPRRLADLVDKATACVTAIGNGTSSDTSGLVDLCVAARYLGIIEEELPLLASAVVADRVDGARKGSNGETFVATGEALIARLRDGKADLADKVAALAAFDRAGIGREPVSEELGSDQLVRTAITAAATATTLLDSDALGTAVAKPVTKALRGAMLLPYWVVVGLTRGGIPRFLALLGLVGGGVLLSLSLLGVLPDALATPGALLGLGAVLFGFGYAALRTGSLIHGAVLFAPIAPLLAVAATRSSTSSTTDQAFGIFTVGTVFAVVVVLILLASLPNPLRSPIGLLVAFAQRQEGIGAWVVMGVRALAAVASATVLVWVTVIASSLNWSAVVNGPRWFWPLLVLAGLAVVGFFFAWHAGRSLQRWRRPTRRIKASHAVRRMLRRRRTTGRSKAWALQPVTHPAGVSAGWSWVYGVLYAGIAVGAVSVIGPAGKLAGRAAVARAKATGSPTAALVGALTVEDMPGALLGLAIGSIVLALALLVAGPVLIPMAARRSLSRSLAADTALARKLVGKTAAASAHPFVDTLIRRGATYRYLTELSSSGRTGLRPTAAGRDVIAAIRSGRGRLWSSLPTSAHVLAAALAGCVAGALPLWPFTAIRAWACSWPGGAWPLAGVGLAVIVALGLLEGWILARTPPPVKPAIEPSTTLCALAGFFGLLAVAVGVDRSELFSDVQVAPLVALLAVVVAAGVGIAVVIVTRRGLSR